MTNPCRHQNIVNRVKINPRLRIVDLVESIPGSKTEKKFL